MEKEPLENINSELFNSLIPEEELATVGGSRSGSTTYNLCLDSTGPSIDSTDTSIDFVVEEMQA